MADKKEGLQQKWWCWVILFVLLILSLSLNSIKEAIFENEKLMPESSENNYESMEDNLKSIMNKSLTNNKKHRSGMKISTLYDDTEIRVEYKLSDLWDESDFVKEVISDYLNFSKRVYNKYNQINSIGFYVKTEMIDSYGNKEEQYVLKINMKKDSFLKFNLSNLDYNPIYNTFKSECDIFEIDASVRKYIKEKDIYYVAE